MSVSGFVGLFPSHHSRPLRAEVQLQNLVAGSLLALGFRFAQHPVAMGLHPDFLVGLDATRYLVIETQTSPVDDVVLRRLSHCVQSLEASGGILVSVDQKDASVESVPQPSFPSRPLVIIGLAGLKEALALFAHPA